jgi:hypothetical protein
MLRTAPDRGVEGDGRAFDFGQLGQGPAAFGRLQGAHHRTPRIWFFGPALSESPEVTGLSPSPVTVMVSPDCSMATTDLRRRLEDDGGAQVVVVRVVGQRFGDARVELGGVGGQVHEGFGAAVDLPQLIVHQALSQRPVAGSLQTGVDGQRDPQAAV